MAKDPAQTTPPEAEAAEPAKYFTAAEYSIRNPYTGVLYDKYGHFPIAEETGDSKTFINVQLAAGVLVLVDA